MKVEKIVPYFYLVTTQIRIGKAGSHIQIRIRINQYWSETFRFVVLKQRYTLPEENPEVQYSNKKKCFVETERRTMNHEKAQLIM